MMKRLFFIVLLLVSSVVFLEKVKGQNLAPKEKEEILIPPGGALMRMEIDQHGDTIFLAQIREVWIFPPLKFKNKKAEQFYWRTVRDVKKTLPYAKLLSQELFAINQSLVSLPNDKARKDYLNEYEKILFKKYEKKLKNLTMSQGKMLIKLVDRETEITSFQLIKIYRGSVSATFWQGIARIFGANLKTQFDNANKEEDAIIERVILLVEAGQL